MIHLNDTDFTPARIREHRELVIKIRDQALKDNNFEWAVILSITIGLLFELAKKEEEHAKDLY